VADFYPSAEHPGFLLDIDLDGDDELEYVIEGSTETRWVITNIPEVGDRDPEFTSSPQTGKYHFLRVLCIYLSDESVGCAKDTCSFRDSCEVFKKFGVVVITGLFVTVAP